MTDKPDASTRRTKRRAPRLRLRGPRDCAELTGGDDPDFAHRLLQQMAETLWLPTGLSPAERQTRVNAAAATLKGLAPRDAAEGLLATQMLATHNAALECLRRAMLDDQTVDGRQSNINLACRLLGLYGRQLTILDRRRGKSQQQVRVEHVQVGDGGQAIVGQVHHTSR